MPRNQGRVQLAPMPHPLTFAQAAAGDRAKAKPRPRGGVLAEEFPAVRTGWGLLTAPPGLSVFR